VNRRARLFSHEALFQRVIDRGELVVQVGAETVDHGDDGERNAGRYQSVLDSCSAGLVAAKLQNKTLHMMLTLQVNPVPPGFPPVPNMELQQKI
jgi:hypothetical protein